MVFDYCADLGLPIISEFFIALRRLALGGLLGGFPRLPENLVFFLVPFVIVVARWCRRHGLCSCLVCFSVFVALFVEPVCRLVVFLFHRDNQVSRLFRLGS